MKDLKTLYKTVEKMPKAELFIKIQESSLEIIPTLQAISGEDKDSVMLYCLFLHTVLALDGRLADEEYASVAPLCKAMFGETFNYEACKAQVRKFSDNKEIQDQMIMLIRGLPEEIAYEMLFVVIAICAIDGKVSKRERDFIEKIVS